MAEKPRIDVGKSPERKALEDLGKLSSLDGMEDAPTEVRRIEVKDWELARAAGVSRDVILAYLKRGRMHVQKPAEKSLVGGLVAEEITAWLVVGHLHQHHGMPASFSGIYIKAVEMLLQATKEWRVILLHAKNLYGEFADVIAGDRKEKLVFDGGGKPPGLTMFDLTKLNKAVEEAMETYPLRFPFIRDCVVRR